MSFDEIGEALFQREEPKGAKRQPARLDDGTVIFDFPWPKVLLQPGKSKVLAR